MNGMNRRLSGVLWLLGIGIAAAGIVLAFLGIGAEPVMGEPPRQAREQAATVLDAVLAGDYETAARGMYGCPDLGVDRAPETPAGALLWDAFVESLDYELAESCQAGENGVTQEVRLTCLDLSAVTGQLQRRLNEALEEREAREDPGIYDENGRFLQEVVDQAMYQAAQECVALDAVTKTLELQLELTYADGRWWVMPEEDLLQAIVPALEG